MAKTLLLPHHLKLLLRMHILLESPRRLLTYPAGSLPFLLKLLPTILNRHHRSFPLRVFSSVKRNSAASSTGRTSVGSLHLFKSNDMAAAPDKGVKSLPTDDRASESKNLGSSRLVVCFDGTGNRFNGDTSDSNIVKLYEKFDRADPNQFHYYQRKSEHATIS